MSCKVLPDLFPDCLSGICERWRVYLSPVLAVAILQGSSAALALDAGYCAAPAEMMSTLQADAGGDVHTLAMMNKHEVDVDTNDPNVKTAQVIMSNSDFSKGYIIKGNAPLGQSSSQLCVSATIRDMEVNDYRIDRDPTVTRYTFNTEAAIEQCETIEASLGGNVACGERSHALRVLEQEENGGQRLAFQGIVTLPNGEDGAL